MITTMSLVNIHHEELIILNTKYSLFKLLCGFYLFIEPRLFQSINRRMDKQIIVY